MIPSILGPAEEDPGTEIVSKVCLMGEFLCGTELKKEFFKYDHSKDENSCSLKNGLKMENLGELRQNPFR